MVHVLDTITMKRIFHLIEEYKSQPIASFAYCSRKLAFKCLSITILSMECCSLHVDYFVSSNTFWFYVELVGIISKYMFENIACIIRVKY